MFLLMLETRTPQKLFVARDHVLRCLVKICGSLCDFPQCKIDIGALASSE